MEWQQLLTGALSIFGILGGGYGYFVKSRGDSIIKYQAIEIQNRDGRINFLEKEIAAITAERDSLKEQVVVLTNLAQGSPQLVKLTTEIKNLVKVVQNIVGK